LVLCDMKKAMIVQVIVNVINKGSSGLSVGKNRVLIKPRGRFS